MSSFLSSRQVKALMENRKKQEAQIQIAQHDIECEKKVYGKALFEINTSAKIERRMRDDALALKKEEQEVLLYNRRRDLALLYNNEMEIWRAEVFSKAEDVEAVKARIMEKAYALRDARNAAKADFVQRAYDAQWRDSCDDARSLDSRALTKFMHAERVRQMEEKKANKENNKDAENEYFAEWTRQLNAMEERDRAKQAARAKANADTAAGLEQQMAFNEAQKENMSAMVQAEAEEEIRQIRSAIKQEEDLQNRKKRDAFLRGREVLEFNSKYKDLKAEEAERQRQQDAILLNHALSTEKASIAAEEAKKRAGFEAAQRYRKYLEEQMIKEAEDTGFVDEINRKEAEKVWKARDDALQARQDARDYLMRLVDQGRQEQIRYKKEQVLQEKQNDVVFASKFIDDIKEGIAKDREASMLRRQAAISNNEALQRQIDERKRQEELAKQEVFLGNLQMKHIERQHQQKLALQGGTVRVNFPLNANPLL